MKVIMKDSIPKVGNKGQVVDVSAGYARNFLLRYHKQKLHMMTRPTQQTALPSKE